MPLLRLHHVTLLLAWAVIGWHDEAQASLRAPFDWRSEFTITGGTATLARTYDQRGAVRTYTNAQNETFTYRFDPNGNLTLLTLPGGKTLAYAYDERDRLDTITDWANRVTDFTYDSVTGDFTGIVRANGTRRVFGYDSGGRLIRIHEQMANGRLISMVRLGFDAAGRMNKRMQIPQPLTATFPAVNHTHNADNWINGLAHDLDGNLLQVPLVPASTSSPTVSQATIGLATVLGTDANAQWDLRNRLIGLTLATGAAMTFTYDTGGLRISKTVAGVPTRYTQNPHGLSGMSEPWIEHRPDGAKRYYVWGGPAGLLYDVTVPAGSTVETVRHYHSDQVGSIIALTNASGVITARFDYTPYGMVTRREGDTDTPFGYCGALGVMTDKETGLIHMRARYYHPWLGRFLNEDPIGFGGGMNWLAYAGNNPISYSDPRGLDRDMYQTLDWATAAGGYDDYSAAAAVDDVMTSSGLNWNHGSSGPSLTAYNEARYEATRAEQRQQMEDIATVAMVVIPMAAAPRAMTATAGAESMTTLYHGGVLRGGAVQAGRLSTTTDIGHAMKYAAQREGGQIYQFQVPTRQLDQWIEGFQVREFRDMLHGTGGSALELRFSPGVAPQLNQYMLPR
jgi:RHS repeat-associated protein